MLKKAGLLVAASVASLVAVSPLAFATDGDQNSGGGGGNGNNINTPFQACNNDVQGQVGLVPVQDVGENPTGLANGAAGIAGAAESKQQSGVDNTRACGQDAGGAGYGNH